MDVFLVAIFGILGLMVVVTIHEFGHYFAARLFGVEVTVFSIGWGPRIYSFYKGKTEWRLALLPLGGMCKMKGEEDFISALDQKKDYIEASPGSFYSTRPWQRIVISFAGPFFNLLSALLVFAFIYMPKEITYEAPPQIILMKDVQYLNKTDSPLDQLLASEQSPAFLGGLRTGDEIIKVDGQNVKTFRELTSIVYQNPGKELTFLVARANEELNLKITPAFNKKDLVGQIGAMPIQVPRILEVKGKAYELGFRPGDQIVEINGKKVSSVVEFSNLLSKEQGLLTYTIDRQGSIIHLQAVTPLLSGKPFLNITFEGIAKIREERNFFEAFGFGLDRSLTMLSAMFRIFDFIGRGAEATSIVSGPVRNIETIGYQIMVAADEGPGEMLKQFGFICALISIALFFGNLLPIPALDGGQIMLSLAEMIKRKPLKLKTIKVYNTIGFAMILVLLAIAIGGDIFGRF